MSQPLPSPWLDTGLRSSVSCGGSVQFGESVSAFGYLTGTPGHEFVGGSTTLQIGHALFYAKVNDISSIVGHLEIWVNINGADTLLEDTGVVADDYLPETATLGSAHSVSETYSNFRLGVKRVLINPDDPRVPKFAHDYRLVYAWFADENTTRDTLVNGSVGGSVPFDPDFTPGSSPEEVDLPEMTISAEVFGASRTTPVIYAYFTGLFDGTGTVNAPGTMDTDGIYTLVSAGGGAATVRSETTPGGDGIVAAGISPGYKIVEDVDCPLFGGATSSGVTVQNGDGETHSVPYTLTKTRAVVTWLDTSADMSTFRTLRIDGTWASDGAHPERATEYPVADRPLLIYGCPAMLDPSVGGQSYAPVRIQFETERDIRQSGDWEAKPDGSYIEINENATSTKFIVHTVGGYARRTQGTPGTDTPSWRRWLGVGVEGKSDTSFDPDLTQRTKSDDAVWDWGNYAWLRLDFVGVPADGDLTLTVSGVYVIATDTHVTGSQRNDDFAVSEIPFTAVYVVPVRAGDGRYFVDLAFPFSATRDTVALDINLGFRLGRIDRLELSGFSQAGTWELTVFKLISRFDTLSQLPPGKCWVKVGFGTPVQRGDYDALSALQNSMQGCDNVADRTNCTELFSVDGHAFRFVNVLTGSESGEIEDSQRNVNEFLTLVGGLEGWTAVYDADLYWVAMRDAFGVTMAEIAQDVRQGDFSFDAGTGGGDGYSPLVNPMVSEIIVVNGLSFAIYTRQPVAGMVYALASVGGMRAPAGQSLTLGSLTRITDNHGLVRFDGEPTGTSIPDSI